MREQLAIWLGRGAGMLSRWLGRGGGTTLPGVMARRIAPNLLQYLSAQLPRGVLLVAGTNGKTTTTRMLADVLTHAGWRVVHNRSGANLVSGVSAVMLAHADWRGRMHHDVALLECDEAALPYIIHETQPRIVVLHNLFRDQLDRYGEVDTIAQHWLTALAELPDSTIVCIQGDDPSLARLAQSLMCRVVVYGNDDLSSARNSVAHLADAGFCRCGHALTYTTRFFAHIGHYTCPQCGFTRPTPDYAITQIHTDGLAGSSITINQTAHCVVPLPGSYNAINALAAYTVADVLGIATAVAPAIAQMQPAFGRYEVVQTPHHALVMALIKNPVGASETIRMFVEAWEQPANLLIVINDRDADGTDVSWLWDADFEHLVPHVHQVFVSGTRAADMRVRMQYAGTPTTHIHYHESLVQALDAGLAQTPAGHTLSVLPTYTAMLDLREILVERGWSKPFWQD
ncbi:MAG: Mur ligase family protein [Chloroflexi bacterium]|nr:Mur ligase family protein [Chloroflexota bacterium]